MLVDSGAWYAVANAADRHHKRAKGFYGEHIGGTPFVTTDLVVAETMALLTAHLGRPAAIQFWGSVREARIPVLTMEATDLEAAWHIAHAYPDQDFSFVDCTSFAVMERLSIHDAFSFDAHFLFFRFGPGRRRPFRRFPES